MRRAARWGASIAAGALVSAGATLGAAAQCLVGERVTLASVYQSSLDAPAEWLDPLATATIGAERVEFPSLRTLELALDPGNPSEELAIDIGPNWIELNYAQAIFYTGYAQGVRNDYELRFSPTAAARLRGVSIDALGTTLAVSAERISVQDGVVTVNLAGVVYDVRSRLRLVLDVEGCAPSVS